jgi:hypothetical protein
MFWVAGFGKILALVFKSAVSAVGVNTESTAATESSPVSPGQGSVKKTLDCRVVSEVLQAMPAICGSDFF